MPRPALEFHPAAAEEARAAREWYEARSAPVAERFVAELDRALERILDGPDQWPKYIHGTRQYKLHRFPYLMVYRQVGDVVQVLAVAHARRRPGHWRARARS